MRPTLNFSLNFAHHHYLRVQIYHSADSITFCLLSVFRIVILVDSFQLTECDRKILLSETWNELFILHAIQRSFSANESKNNNLLHRYFAGQFHVANTDRIVKSFPQILNRVRVCRFIQRWEQRSSK